MEGLFWVLFFLPVAFIAYVIIAGIISAIINGFKGGKYVKKYVAKGLIGENEKAQLPEILLETAQDERTAENVNQAISLLEDCLQLCKIKDNKDLGKSASFELARCYAAKGMDEKALECLRSLTTPQAYLLHGELLLKRNKRGDCNLAETYLKNALESEDTKARAEELLEQIDVIFAEQDRENTQKRFEDALRFCVTYGAVRVGRGRFLPHGNHFASLKSLLDKYEAIETFAGSDKRKEYGKQLAVLAFYIADLCCFLGFHESAYAYLESENFSDFPQVSFLYAMLYANMGPQGYYGYSGTFSKSVAKDEVEKRLKKMPIPSGTYEWRLKKAIEFAKIAKEYGVSEAPEFVFTLEYQLETHRRNEVIRKVQEKWDKQFEETHGISRDEYEEELEERRKAEMEQQEAEAEAEAKRIARKKRLERDIDVSERLFDKTHDGTGKTMEEKWKMGEITASEYMEYKNKRDQYVDLSE